jgi:hypothetical protein
MVLPECVGAIAKAYGLDAATRLGLMWLFFLK